MWPRAVSSRHSRLLVTRERTHAWGPGHQRVHGRPQGWDELGGSRSTDARAGDGAEWDRRSRGKGERPVKGPPPRPMTRRAPAAQGRPGPGPPSGTPLLAKPCGAAAAGRGRGSGGGPGSCPSARSCRGRPASPAAAPLRTGRRPPSRAACEARAAGWPCVCARGGQRPGCEGPRPPPRSSPEGPAILPLGPK